MGTHTSAWTWTWTWTWTALACLLWPAGAQAGPWTREAGRWYAKVAQGVFVAEGFRDADGAFRDDATYVGLSSAFYGELGLGRRLQAQVYWPFVVGINELERDSALRLGTPCEGGRLAEATMRRSFGDLLAGLQWSSPFLKLPHALRINAKLPLYDAGSPRGRCAALFPQPGDGQLDGELWLSLGDSFGEGGRFYAFGELGHRARSEIYLGSDTGRDYGDSFLAAGQLGMRIGEGGFATFNVKLELPYVDDAVTRGGLSLGPGLYWPLGRGFGVELNLGATPWARNAAEGRAGGLFLTDATVGVSHKLD